MWETITDKNRAAINHILGDDAEEKGLRAEFDEYGNYLLNMRRGRFLLLNLEDVKQNSPDYLTHVREKHLNKPLELLPEYYEEALEIKSLLETVKAAEVSICRPKKSQLKPSLKKNQIHLR